MSAQRGVAASQLSQRESERWPGDGIRRPRGAQHSDHIRAPNRVAYPAPRQTPCLRHRADEDHVREVEHGTVDTLVRVLDVRLIDQHEGLRRGRRDPSHVYPRGNAACRIVGRHDDHDCRAIVEAGQDFLERERIR